MMFYLGLHNLYVVLSGFHDLYVILFWLTQTVCGFILLNTIFMWFYLGSHTVYVVLSWFTQSSQLSILLVQ